MNTDLIKRILILSLMILAVSACKLPLDQDSVITGDYFIPLCSTQDSSQ